MLISLNLINMLPAIKLYDQLRFRAEEVHDVTTHRLLASKLETVYLPGTQVHPELAFTVSLVTA